MVTIYYPNWIEIDGLPTFKSVEDACEYALASLGELHAYLVGTDYEIAAVVCDRTIYYPRVVKPVPGEAPAFE